MPGRVRRLPRRREQSRNRADRFGALRESARMAVAAGSVTLDDAQERVARPMFAVRTHRARGHLHASLLMDMLRTRKVTHDRAVTNMQSSWRWHTTYDYYSSAARSLISPRDWKSARRRLMTAPVVWSSRRSDSQYGSSRRRTAPPLVIGQAEYEDGRSQTAEGGLTRRFGDAPIGEPAIEMDFGVDAPVPAWAISRDDGSERPAFAYRGVAKQELTSTVGRVFRFVDAGCGDRDPLERLARGRPPRDELFEARITTRVDRINEQI